MDPAAFFQGFEGSLVTKFCSAEVFLLLKEYVAEVIIAVGIVLVVLDGVLIRQYCIVVLAHLAVRDSQEEEYLSDLYLQSFVEVLIDVLAHL